MGKRSFIDMIKSNPKIAADYLPKAPIEPEQDQEQPNVALNQIEQKNMISTTNTILDQNDQSNLISDQSDHDQQGNIDKITEKNSANNPFVANHQASQLTTNNSVVNHQINHQHNKVVNHQVNHQSPMMVNHQQDNLVNHQVHPVVNYKSSRSQDRHAKSRNLLAVRLPNEFIDEVKDFCKEKNLLLQDVVELALRNYMEKVVNHQNTNELTAKVVNQLTHDDQLMIYKTHDDIIMLYRRLTNKKWSAADDRVAYKMNDVDLKIIEVGMIHTFIQAKGKKINSFAYFVPEIKNVIDAKFDRQHLSVYLKSRRKLLNDFLVKIGRDPLIYANKDKD